MPIDVVQVNIPCIAFESLDWRIVSMDFRPTPFSRCRMHTTAYKTCFVVHCWPASIVAPKLDSHSGAVVGVAASEQPLNLSHSLIAKPVCLLLGEKAPRSQLL
jgi:hypothetical protein